MIRLFANANYDFIKWRRWAFSTTGAIMLVGLAFLLTRGLNYSIEFTGGTLVQFEVAHKVPTSDIRAALDQTGLKGAEISNFGSDTSYVVRARLGAEAAQGEAGTQEVADAVARALDRTVGAGQYYVARREAVGPKVGRELQSKALIAILVSFLVTLVYLAVRFEWRFGLAAVVATAHDVVATIAFISVMHLEVSLVVVGAVLTVVGYSLNDTIITLSLLVLAGEVIRPFAWVMSFGIFTGTFSSIYIAAPVLLWIEKRWPGEDARGARALGTRVPAGTEKFAPATPTSSPSPRTPQPTR